MFTRGAYSIARRCMSSSVKNLKMTKSEPSVQLMKGEVRIQLVAAPIHASDVANPCPGGVGGLEGVGVVSKIGEGVTGLREGDWVLPKLGFGAWCEEAVVPAASVVRVPNDIPASFAATMAVDAATAYRVLRDFKTLREGDCLIQNDASSPTGLAVIQMAREMGVKTINVVDPNTPDLASVLSLLSTLGGDINITDDYVNTAACNELLQDLPPCQLALNGDGAVTELVRVVAPGGVLVSYNQSAHESQVPFDLVASKNLSLKSFSVSGWYERMQNTPLARAQMNADIADAYRTDKLSLFYQEHDFDDFEHALRTAQEPFGLRKVVLRMDYPDRFAEHDAKDPKEYEIFETGVI